MFALFISTNTRPPVLGLPKFVSRIKISKESSYLTGNQRPMDRLIFAPVVHFGELLVYYQATALLVPMMERYWHDVE